MRCDFFFFFLRGRVHGGKAWERGEAPHALGFRLTSQGCPASPSPGTRRAPSAAAPRTFAAHRTVTDRQTGRRGLRTPPQEDAPRLTLKRGPPRSPPEAPGPPPPPRAPRAASPLQPPAPRVSSSPGSGACKGDRRQRLRLRRRRRQRRGPSPRGQRRPHPTGSRAAASPRLTRGSRPGLPRRPQLQPDEQWQEAAPASEAPALGDSRAGGLQAS